VRWLPSIALLLMGAAVSQDIELHLTAGTILVVVALLLIAVGKRSA
jgi:hypothetical protein